MEADWEVEVGGGAPVIEAYWPGFVDLRRDPGRIAEIAEAAGFAAFAKLLLALNSPDSPVWTAKCDLWEPDGDGTEAALAVYVDVLPRAGLVFADWQEAVDCCRQWTARMAVAEAPECGVELIVRQAFADPAEGLGVTAYLRSEGRGRPAAAEALSRGLAAFAGAIRASQPAGRDRRIVL